MFARFAGCWLLAALAAGSAFAEPTTTKEDALDLPDIVKMALGAGAEAISAKPQALPKFEEVTKDMKSAEGLFTLWCYPAEAKDKDREKLLCQIPASFLGEKFMLSVSYSGGGFLTGFPLEERVVMWEVLDRQLLLVEPETRYVVDKSKTVSDVVRRTYPDRIRKAVPIVTKSSGGDPLIDLGPMLKSDFADIGWMMFGGGGMINSSLSKWTKKKTFELNVEIGVELAVSRMFPKGSFDKRLLHYSFWKLPQSDYTPRVGDDRIGYFLTANRDWSKPTDARDIFNRYVDRWNLVKRDRELKMCEPKKPIVFYIEKTVPVRFRRAVRDGILEWNKAFAKCGFVDAVQVRQQTADNEWADIDPEDMRYSFFRWIVTGAGFAMGPHRGNPFTGEIYDADIIFDDSMIRYFEQSAEQMLPSALTAMKTEDPKLREFFERFPQFRRGGHDWDGPEPRQENVEKLRAAMHEHQCRCGRPVQCEWAYVEGMKREMAFAGAVLAGQPPEVKERFLYDVIKEVVMHEVGHTLGLRHNFAASTVYTLEQIKDKRTKGEATVGSVMDYNPVLFFKEGALEGHFITPTIGPYDYWAIEYGYRPSDGSYKGQEDKKDKEEAKEKAEKDEKEASTPKAAETKVEVKIDPDAVAQLKAQIPPEMLEQLPPEVKQMIESGDFSSMIQQAAAEAGGAAPTPPKGPSAPMFKGPNAAELKMLHEIAARAGEPEMAYASDQDTTILGPDPRAARFDAGADPLEWAETRIALIDDRMSNILEWAVKDKESWYHVRQSFTSLLVQKAFVLDYVGRYIGGQYVSRAHRGDPQAGVPFKLVDAETQRRALSFIEQHLFSDEFFTFPPEVLNHLAASRWWHEGSWPSFTVYYPLLRYVGLLQWWNLVDRLFPNTLRRIHDAELKTDDADKFTAAEYIQRLQKAVWRDSMDLKRAGDGNWSDARPFVSKIRRSLQREYLGVMEPLVRFEPGIVLPPDLDAMLKYSLQKLAQRIDKTLAVEGLDFASEAHLATCKSRIERMLAPELKEYGGYGLFLSGGGT